MISPKLKKTLLVVGILAFGTATSLTAKIQFQMSSVDSEGVERKFEKPWFETLVMFVAMTLCMLVHGIGKCRDRNKRVPHLQESLLLNADVSDVKIDLSQPPKPKTSTLKSYLLIFLPAIFDLLATTLSGIGLLFTVVSVYQMLRGALLVFSAFLSVVFLKRKLYNYNWAGILLCLVALIVVGAASLMSDNGGVPFEKEILGISLIVGGQLLQAAQFVVEEFLLKNVEAPPLVIVGMEGVWGTILMAALFCPILYAIPGADAGSYENTYDSFVMLSNNPNLLFMAALYCFVILAYNINGMWVTLTLSAVHHTILDALRTITVWAVDLMLFYVFTDGELGEAWDVYSWMQLFGFVLLVLGTLVYDNIVTLPFLSYPIEYDELQGKKEEPTRNLASPLMSPFMAPTNISMTNQTIPPVSLAPGSPIGPQIA